MYQLALIVKRRDRVHFSLLVNPCPPPLPPNNLDDLPLWDIPCTPLLASSDQKASPPSCPVAAAVHSSLHSIGVAGLDVNSSVHQLKEKLGSLWEVMQPWQYWKFLEEPDYGPGPQCCTIFFMAELSADEELSSVGRWLTSEDVWRFLTGSHATVMRIGPLATYSLSPHFPKGLQNKLKLTMNAQEYPPGVLLVPLESSTKKPFSKTNLVIFTSKATIPDNTLSLISGEALIVDPGCHPPEAQGQLSSVLSALPRKMLIFLTHHHIDHIEGLPTVYRQNPEAVILAHEFTLRRLGKAARKLKRRPVVDGSIIVVGDQVLRVIAAPGHTDGHLALLHVPSHTLIAGDHCVGKGSALLDVTSGGSMKDYLETTQKFIDMAPHVIVPMHGHFNLWPVHMMKNHLRHREAREAKILFAINQGAHTAFQIISEVYADTPLSLWTAALGNVILHVDHLHDLEKLPKEFSMVSFRKSCKIDFMMRLVGQLLLEIASKRDGVIWKISLALSLGSGWLIWRRMQTS